MAKLVKYKIKTIKLKYNVGDGENENIALAYSASGFGPIYESDFPFESIYDEEKNEITEIGYYDNEKWHSKGEEYANAVRTLIKNHIKEHGAVSASVYMDMWGSLLAKTSGEYNSDYYNKEKMHISKVMRQV